MGLTYCKFVNGKGDIMKSIEQRNKTLFKAFHENIEAQTKAMFYEWFVNSRTHFVSENPALGSKEYKDKMAKALKRTVAVRDKAPSLREFAGSDYKELLADHEYMQMAYNEYLFEKFGLDSEQIKSYFDGKSDGAIHQEYYTNFRPFLIKQKLQTMGGVITAEQLETRLKRAKLRKLMTHEDSKDFSNKYIQQCDREYEAYYLAKVFMETMGVQEIDLLAFFNANSLGLYAELTRTPKTGKLEGVTFKPITPHELEYKEIIE